MFITQEYYNNIIRKDLILKTLSEHLIEVPSLEKLEIRIFFPKIIDDFSKIFEGLIYLEELTGQMPIKKILSTKRVGAHDYEKSVLIFVTLRKEKIFFFFLYFYLALIFYWEESKNVLLFQATANSKNGIIQLVNKEFFYLFNMPIEYDDRQYEWNLQFMFFFQKKTSNVKVDLLGYIFSHYLPYAIFNIKKGDTQEEIEQSEEDII